MDYIHKIFEDLQVNSVNSLDEFNEQYDKKVRGFVETNELCRIILNYDNVFRQGTVENGPSSVVVEARKTGKSVAEVLANIKSC